MVTPIVEETGEVDTESLRAYTEFLVDAGVNGLFPCGSTGEFSSLTRRQRRRVIETVVDTANDVTVLAGCGETSLEGIDRLITDTAEVGADAAVVVTPYYLEVTQESLRKFFTTVADRSRLPIVLYEIPALTGQQFTVETVVDLAEHENIVGLKSSMGNVLQFHELVANTPESFDILTGLPELTIPSLNFGGSGVIAGPANVFPATVTEVVECYRQQAYEQAVELMREVIMPILSAIRSMPSVPALKYMLSLRGYDVGPPLQPMPELTESQRSTLEALFVRLEGSPIVAANA